MNNYGHQAMAYWQRVAPGQFQGLEDPQGYFTEVGELLAGRVEQICLHLEATLPPDLDYLARVGQLRAIRAQAQEVAFSELVYDLVTPEPSSLALELEQMLGQLPNQDMIEEDIRWIWDRAEDEAESQGHKTVGLLEADQELVDLLEALRPLVSLDKDPYEMTDLELTERISALRPHYEAIMARRN